MAATKTEQATALKIKVETGTTASGATKVSTRSISNINPELSTQDAYDIALALANLQNYPLHEIQSVDTAVLVEDS